MLPSKKTLNRLPGILNDFFGNEWITKTNQTSPAINIIENEKEYKVEIAAPGITKDELKIKVREDNCLVVSLHKEEKQSEGNDKYLRREFSYTQFQQTLILPENADKEKIDAKWDNGVLNVIIPKKECSDEQNAKEIEIK